jgi:hypothetical protein
METTAQARLQIGWAAAAGGPAMRPRRYRAALAGALVALPLTVSALVIAPPPTGGWIDPEATPPDCSNAAPSVTVIWPPDHKMVAVQVDGITDPNNLQVTVMVTGITQDESVDALGSGNTWVDGNGVGTPTAFVRAERAGPGTGRLYFIAYTATNSANLSCSGVVKTWVPHDMGQGYIPVDTGLRVDSTLPVQ